MIKEKIIINSIKNEYGKAPWKDFELTLLYI